MPEQAEKKVKLDKVTPVGKRVIVAKDKDRETTKGGIVLPDTTKIPQWTGRVVAIGTGIQRDGYSDEEYPFRMYDKVLVNPAGAIPVEFENGASRDNWFVIPAENIIAIFSKEDGDDED